MEFILEHWVELATALLVFVKVIINLTPSVEDNRVVGYVDAIFDALITNRTQEKN